METIDQDPNDIVLQEPVKANNGLPFKIATCVLAGTTILFGLIAFFNGNKPAETKKDESKSDSSQTADAPAAEEKEDLTLKNFDVNIGKLVNAAGFYSGSILTIKTNADGTYMFGEVRSNGVTGFVYRKLPSGEWTGTSLTPIGEAANCEELDKSLLEAFAGVTFSDKTELKCGVEEAAEKEDDPPVRTTMTVSEALKGNYYKD